LGTIRLLLAFSVLASHASAVDVDIMPGPIAVQLFFVMSGFYMSLILTKKYAKRGIFLFYTNRLLRLFPTYFVVCLTSLVVLCLLDVGIFTHLDKMKRVLSTGPLVAASLLWTNMAVIGQEALYLLRIDPASGFFSWSIGLTDSQEAWKFLLVPQAWSLSLELWFYLLAPFMVKLGNRSIIILFLLSLALRLYIGSKGPAYDLFARRFFPAELCFFLTGVLSCRLLERIQKNQKAYLVGIVSFGALCLAILCYDKIDFPGSFALLTLIAFLTIPFIFNSTKNSMLDSFLGRISYPVYMVHFLIVSVFEEYMEEYSIFSLLAVVFGAALLVYFVIEMPIDRWRQWRVEKTLTNVARSSLAEESRIQNRTLPWRATC
jgi:peptidoglycan/LPS O-acetylase OafA/YrhL